MRLKIVLLRSVAVIAVLLVAGVATLFLAFDRGQYIDDTEPAADLFIRGGMLFDATRTQPVVNPGILVRDGVIACIGGDCGSPSESVVVIDAAGLAIVPGLIDLHVHFFAITQDNAGMSMPGMIWDYARARPNVRRKLLESGVTSIRDLGNPRDSIIEVRNWVNSGELAGPRMFVAGPLFTAPGGHPAYGGRDPNTAGVGGDMAFQSNDPDDARREVAVLAEQGVDGIKAVLHGATSSEGAVLLPSLSVETLRAIVDEAGLHDLWVAVHVGPLDEAREAARLGITSIEHGVRGGNRVDGETIRALVDYDVVYVPTLGREPQGHLNIAALYTGGVTIGVGTDTNNPEMAYGDSYHLELARLVDAGMPAAAVLVAATRHGAKALNKADSLGTIEVGKQGDILLVRGEPWSDIGDLRSIDTVIQAGRVVIDNGAR